MIGKIEHKLKMDDYDREAVFTPAIVNLLILSFVLMCTILPLSEDAAWWHTALAIATPLASAVIITRFIMYLFRGTSYLYEDIFYRKDRLRFPTTSMLLLNDKSISQVMKKRVRNDLKTLYNMPLFTKAQEEDDEMEARRTAKDAVSLIRKTVADSNDSMTRRKLKRYGLFRNFLGGAIYCIPLSIIFLVFDSFSTGRLNPIILATILIYFLIAVIDVFLAQSAAIGYAESLITTFDKLNTYEA